MKMEGEIHMTRKDLIRVAACAAVFGIVGGASFQGVNYLYNQTVGSSVMEEKVKESLSPLFLTSFTQSYSLVLTLSYIPQDTNGFSCLKSTGELGVLGCTHFTSCIW